ncbi:PAS domain-containing protein [Alteromonas sediminis]|uniref:PAS domain-containing protein n=1 Tax=Alteromonas sediminis TaxID=2259342 RepID=A0A3N5XYW9_9ALTE|nr:PAS domain-containing protein [Alteromonas sediminis]RPJ65860.1 PAS domain-containing protein [Alteromonas sediminis]
MTASRCSRWPIFSYSLALLAVMLKPTCAYAITASVRGLGDSSIILLLSLIGITVMGLIAAVFTFFKRTQKGQAALQASEEEKQQIQAQIDLSIDGILQLDDDNVIRYANQSAAYFLEKKLEELVGKPVLSVCENELASQLQDAQQSSSGKITLYCQLGYHKRHARLRWVRYKKPLGDITSSLHIDDVNQLQSDLSAVEADKKHLCETLDNADTLIANADFETQILTPNNALCELLKLEPNSTLSLDTLHKYFNDNDSLTFKRFWTKLQDGENQTLDISILVRGVIIPISISAQIKPIGDQDTVSAATLVVTNLLPLHSLKEKLAAGQKLIQSMLSASPFPMYVLNENSQIVECNRKLGTLFKVDVNRIKNKRLEDIDAFDDYFKSLHTGATGTLAAQKSALLTMKDGRQLDVNMHFAPLMTATQHKGCVVIIEDLTAIKAIEAEAQRHEKTVIELLDNAPIGVGIFDNRYQFKRVNQALLDQLKLKEDNLLNQTFTALFDTPELAVVATKHLHKAGKLEDFEADFIDANGHVFSTRLDVNKLSENAYVCWVTDARRQEYLNHQLERLITYSNMPIGLLNDDGFTKLNPAACAFFDITKEDELLGLSPASEVINPSPKNAQEMAQHLAELKQNKQVLSFSWTHEHHDETLPCEITLVPLFSRAEHSATLCMWTDLRALKKANAARIEAVNLRQAAEKEVAEKQRQLQNSQDLLASRAQTLESTQQKLEAAESDLATKLSTIKELQQAHEDITDHLSELQSDYERNRELLAQSQNANAELESQLEASSNKVNHLERQRNQIADALQFSERRNKEAQEQLAESEQTTQLLKEEHEKHLASMQASQAKIDELKHSIEEKDQQINDVSDKITNLQSQLASSGKASEKLREQLVNQRKASELAEQKRRDLEKACEEAQAQLSNKSQYVEHLQKEMQMLENMAEQQVDLNQQTQLLEQELAQKQQQLDETQAQLDQARESSEQEKQNSANFAAELEKLQKELQDVENRSQQQKAEIAEVDKKWLAQQQAMQDELANKQQELDATLHALENAQQQTAEEKKKQEERVRTLEAELKDVEQRALAQEQEMASNDQQLLQQQETLANELAAKKEQLNQTKQQLEAHQQQVEEEKQQRKAQQEKLTQLSLEMADVQSRANKQKEILEGSDEQWRNQQSEIEKQKEQLQQALEHAENQNQLMQLTLDDKLRELKQAETAVSQTHSDEQKLQEELNKAKEQADSLLAKLMQQEDEEQKLKQQVYEQQNSLQERENSIQSLQEEQQRLTQALQSVTQEYEQTKASYSEQHQSQQKLTDQLEALEEELKHSRKQLSDKEYALVDAQKQIATSKDKLAAQEQALIETQKEELKHFIDDGSQPIQIKKPDFADLPLPENPSQLFDLLPYLQDHKGVTSLASSLNELMDNLHSNIVALDKAVAEDDSGHIHISTRKLVHVLEEINSEPLKDMAEKLQLWSENQLIDNISISWPSSRGTLMSTLRVIYSHLHSEI